VSSRTASAKQPCRGTSSCTARSAPTCRAPSGQAPRRKTSTSTSTGRPSHSHQPALANPSLSDGPSSVSRRSVIRQSTPQHPMKQARPEAAPGPRRDVPGSQEHEAPAGADHPCSGEAAQVWCSGNGSTAVSSPTGRMSFSESRPSALPDAKHLQAERPNPVPRHKHQQSGPSGCSISWSCAGPGIRSRLISASAGWGPPPRCSNS
jgi:hypothetical protein